MSRLKIATIFLRYGVDKYATALENLNSILPNIMGEVEHETLVVDNAIRDDDEIPPDSILKIIAGDNSSWEFSGWDRGIEHLGNEIWNYDYINLVSSAFAELYNDYLKRFNVSHLLELAGKPVALGHIDCYNAPVCFGYHRFQHWMRSSFILIAPSELKALGSLVSVEGGDGIFSEDHNQPFLCDSPVSANYQEYIISWLTGSGTGQGTEWHSKFELQQENFKYFQQKSKAIFNEQLFSVRLRALGCKLIDVTWYDTMKKNGNTSIDLNTHWREQLQNRDSGKVVV